MAKKKTTKKTKKSKVVTDLTVGAISRDGSNYVLEVSGSIVVTPGEGKEGAYANMAVGGKFDPTSKDN